MFELRKHSKSSPSLFLERKKSNFFYFLVVVYFQKYFFSLIDWFSVTKWKVFNVFRLGVQLGNDEVFGVSYPEPDLLCPLQIPQQRYYGTRERGTVLLITAKDCCIELIDKARRSKCFLTLIEWFYAWIVLIDFLWQVQCIGSIDIQIMYPVMIRFKNWLIAMLDGLIDSFLRYIYAYVIMTKKWTYLWK